MRVPRRELNHSCHRQVCQIQVDVLYPTLSLSRSRRYSPSVSLLAPSLRLARNSRPHCGVTHAASLPAYGHIDVRYIHCRRSCRPRNSCAPLILARQSVQHAGKFCVYCHLSLIVPWQVHVMAQQSTLFQVSSVLGRRLLPSIFDPLRSATGRRHLAPDDSFWHTFPYIQGLINYIIQSPVSDVCLVIRPQSGGASVTANHSAFLILYDALL